jgi:alkyl hydroperoxide reductase subunit AhpC
MLKTAVAVEADLASRIAIRYACQLGRSIDMTISTIHALEPGEEGQAIATGWVRQTWEKRRCPRNGEPGRESGQVRTGRMPSTGKSGFFAPGAQPG